MEKIYKIEWVGKGQFDNTVIQIWKERLERSDFKVTELPTEPEYCDICHDEVATTKMETLGKGLNVCDECFGDSKPKKSKYCKCKDSRPVFERARYLNKCNECFKPFPPKPKKLEKINLYYPVNKLFDAEKYIITIGNKINEIIDHLNEKV